MGSTPKMLKLGPPEIPSSIQTVPSQAKRVNTHLLEVWELIQDTEPVKLLCSKVGIKRLNPGKSTELCQVLIALVPYPSPSGPH